MDGTKLTGLWKNKDKNGNTFLSGTLNQITQIMVMPNSFKKPGDRSPDYYVYIAAKDKMHEDKKDSTHADVAL